MLNLLRPHFNRAQKNAELASAENPIPVPPLSAYGLRPREAEVAAWVAPGEKSRSNLKGSKV
jgi:hypothetical protein